MAPSLEHDDSAPNVQTGPKVAGVPPPSLKTNAAESYGDWRDDFFKNGYHVFKQAITEEKATSYYARKAREWLASFDNGFSWDDKTTWTKEHIPQNFRNMFLNYCAAHEKFMWDMRTEPGIKLPFEQLWKTDELLVSFDTFNITLPTETVFDYTPWPHVDQAPERKGLACVQGLLNLSPAGPRDGGLLLMPGTAALFEEFFEHNPVGDRSQVLAKHYDFNMFTQEQVKWFEDRGCKTIKVCADPGDLILWDSRTVHHVALPETDTVRTVMYVCFTPAALAKPEDIEVKKSLFQSYQATTHWPHCNIYGHGKAMVNGTLDPLEREEPLEKPVVTKEILKLAGAMSY